MARTPKTTTAPTGSIAPLGLRMLPELRQKIEEAAKVNGRSMNAEISARLEASFDNDAKVQTDELIREMRRTQLRLERAELYAQYGQLLEEGRFAAQELKKLKKERFTPEAQELDKTFQKVRLAKSHLDAKVAAIDARLSELSPKP